MAKKEDGNDNGRFKRKEYEKELSRLQEELCKLQDWIKYKGLRVIIVFEGRDAAGKAVQFAQSQSGSVRAFSV